MAEPPSQAFSGFLRRLVDGLGRVGLHLEGVNGGTLREEETDFGVVSALRAGGRLDLELRPVNWVEAPAVLVRLAAEPIAGGSEIRIEAYGWKETLETAGGTVPGWMAGALLPAVFRELAPASLGEWVMDEQARRPSGPAAVETYRDPTYHRPNFLLILDRMQLTPADRLLEVACGGGALLHKALESGCTATGVDHSPEMVRLAREVNRLAVTEGRLTVVEGNALALPVADGAFTSCVCTGAFNFFPDPLLALREMHRSLAAGGRLAVFADTAEVRGTIASPEPFASRCRFYEPDELADLARRAGFSEVTVETPSLLHYARAAGLPSEALEMFAGSGGGVLLRARKLHPVLGRGSRSSRARAGPPRTAKLRRGEPRGSGRRAAPAAHSAL